VQRTCAGELPLRDFRSYDPGRYFWCAAFAPLFGKGLVAVRIATATFGALGLACGLLAARRVVGSRWMLVPVAVLLQLWMIPPWKAYESALALMGVLVATRYLEQPSLRRLFCAGGFAGLAAFFGRNLGVYGACAMACVALLAWWKGGREAPLRKVAAFALGILAGYLPMLVLLLVPGYLTAFVESIGFYLRQGELNAELPLPWPWRVGLAGQPLGWLFVLLVAWNVVGLFASLATRAADLSQRAVLVAALFVGLFWAHHASVRSDVFHLAQVSHPLWIGCLALPATFLERRRNAAQAALLALFLATGVLALWNVSPVLRRPSADAASVEALVTLVREHVKPDEDLWVGPQYLGLYPLLERRSPCWDIYPAWQASEREQDRMLAELAGVQWALLDVRPIGGAEERLLSSTHPRVWAMLQRDFERRPAPGAPATLLFLRRRKP
jgi:hypothetical protein